MKIIGNYYLVKEWDGKCPKCKSDNIEHDPEIAGMGKCDDCGEYINKNWIVIE